MPPAESWTSHSFSYLYSVGYPSISPIDPVDWRVALHVDIDDSEGPIRKDLAHQRRRDVEHRHVAGGSSFRLSVMRVPVDDSGDREAADRFLEAAAAEERKDFARLSFDGCLDRGVVEDGHQLLGSQTGECGFEFQSFVHRLPDEVLDDLLAPGSEGAPAKAAAESLDAREADTV